MYVYTGTGRCRQPAADIYVIIYLFSNAYVYVNTCVNIYIYMYIYKLRNE